MAKKQEDFHETDVAATKRGDCPACKAMGVILKDVQGMMVCEKCAAKRFSSKVRKSIQEAFDRQRDQMKREAWVKRVQFARKGMEYYDEHKFPEALKVFREYIAILENHHSVPPGGLHPSTFTEKKDQGEILLIAGIYWDMAKIYDRMKGRQTDMRQCLNKFFEFSVDRPHLILASEACRRFIASKKCVHIDDFKNTHRLLRSKLAKCFIASAVFGPTSPEVDSLRRFRDRSLLASTPGRMFVAAYYVISPSVALFLVRRPAASRCARALLRPLARFVSE